MDGICSLRSVLQTRSEKRCGEAAKYSKKKKKYVILFLFDHIFESNVVSQYTCTFHSFLFTPISNLGQMCCVSIASSITSWFMSRRQSIHTGCVSCAFLWSLLAGERPTPVAHYLLRFLYKCHEVCKSCCRTQLYNRIQEQEEEICFTLHQRSYLTGMKRV